MRVLNHWVTSSVISSDHTPTHALLTQVVHRAHAALVANANDRVASAPVTLHTAVNGNNHVVARLLCVRGRRCRRSRRCRRARWEVKPSQLAHLGNGVAQSAVIKWVS